MSDTIDTDLIVTGYRDVVCAECGGTGRALRKSPIPKPLDFPDRCPSCDGRGRIVEARWFDRSMSLSRGGL